MCVCVCSFIGGARKREVAAPVVALHGEPVVLSGGARLALRLVRGLDVVHWRRRNVGSVVPLQQCDRGVVFKRMRTKPPVI